MRHRDKRVKLGREREHRRALLRNWRGRWWNMAI